MKLLLTPLLVFVVNTLFAQKLLKGIVLDPFNKPVAAASVFLNNTSIGTTSDVEGRFELNVPQGKFELIISSIGFETSNTPVNSSILNDVITIHLKIKEEQLETILIEPFDKDGWKKWGQFFIDNFIGTSRQSRHCKIKNPEVLRFRHSRKNNELTAIALEPLIIENKALGYNIRYDLQAFSYSSKTGYLYYAGYPFFEELKGTQKESRKWKQERADIYYGSMLQFMRAVYSNKVLEEGFEVRSLKKPTSPMFINVKPQENSTFFLQLPGQNDIVGTSLLTGDSIAYKIDETTAGLAFPDYLLVYYRGKTPPNAYILQTHNEDPFLSSEITLLNNKEIEIQSNGIYLDPRDLLTLGFWAWSEKVANILPFDYEVDEN